MPDIGYRIVLNDPELNESTQFDLRPQEVETEVPHLLNVIPLPKGNRHVESQGEGITTISFRHTYGQRTRNLNGQRLDGRGAFNYFEEECYRRYLTLKRTLPKSKQSNLLEFHDWERNRHHYCEIKTFQNPRNEDNRLYFEFILEILLIREISPDVSKFVEPDNLTIAGRALADLQASGERLKGYGETLKETRDSLVSTLNRNVLQPVNTVIGGLRSFVTGATSFVVLPLDFMSTLSEGVQTTINNIGALISDPLTVLAQELRDVKRTLYRLRRSPQIFRDSIDGKLEELQQSFFALTSDSDSDLQREAIESGQNSAKRDLSSSISAVSYQAARNIRVKQGDTLRRIAVRELGDVSQWRVLAELNGLDSPYISSAGEPNTVAPGSEILIPVESNTDDPQVTQSFGDSSIRSVEAQVYGVDFKTQFVNRKIDRVWIGNDWATVSGRNNLNQAIDNRLVTPQGALLSDPGYGYPDSTGKKSTYGDLLEQKFRTEQSIQSDSRIENADVTFEVVGNVNSITYRIRPIKATTGRPVEGVVSV